MIKTREEIEAMREGGALLSKALKAAIDAVRPGIKLLELDAIAEQVIRAGGGEPSFKGYKSRSDDDPFPSTLCISVNDEVVHGLGNRDRVLQEGDIVGLDIGLWLKGLCTDMAATVPVGRVSHDRLELMEATKKSLLAAVAIVKAGATIAEVGKAVESVIKPHGYGIVRALVGHGVGHKVHEAPHVPNYYDAKFEDIKMEVGMCLAIEPMIGMGTHKVSTLDDGWTVAMADGKPSAHFEVTVGVTQEGADILTPLPV